MFHLHLDMVHIHDRTFTKPLHNLYATFTYPLHNLYHSQSPYVVGFSVSSAVLLNIPGSGLEVAEMIGYAYAVWLGRGISGVSGER